MAGIEDAGHGQLQPEGVGAEDQRHVGRLVVADAMFAGQSAAHRDHALHEPLADRLDLFQVARFARIEQEIGMQVAVAGVKHIDRRQAGRVRLVVNQLQ